MRAMTEKLVSRMASISTPVADIVACNITAIAENHADELIYQPLPEEEDSIRLLLLQPSANPEDDISCDLISVKVNGDSLGLPNGLEFSYKLKYEALSYAWGDISPAKRILVNSQEVLVRSNLHDCVRRLRKTDQIRPLWIDAICINQADNAEKSRQIRMMARIYSNAERVLAWLGEAADGSDDFICYVNNLKQQSLPGVIDEEAGDCSDSDVLQKRESLFQRPYWNRTWIIQELHMAKAVVFHCGASYVTGIQLMRTFGASRKIGLTSDSERQVEHLLDGQKLFAADGNSDERKYSCIHALLNQYYRTECSDARDKVFALFDILPEHDRARSLKIDYSMTPAHLFARIVELLRLDEQGLPNTWWQNTETLRRALRLQWPEILEVSHDSNFRQHHLHIGRMLDRGEARANKEILEVWNNIDLVDEEVTPNRVRFSTESEDHSKTNHWITGCKVEGGDICCLAPWATFALVIDPARLVCRGGAWQLRSVDEAFGEGYGESQALAEALLDPKQVAIIEVRRYVGGYFFDLHDTLLFAIRIAERRRTREKENWL